MDSEKTGEMARKKFAEIHAFLNMLVDSANKVKDELREKGWDCALTHSAGNYLKIAQQYEEQRYAIPLIVVDGIGDIGFNLDGVFFEFGRDPKRYDFVAMIGRLSQISCQVEIYEFKDNNYVDYYQSGTTDPEEAGLRITRESRFCVMIDLYFTGTYAADRMADLFVVAVQEINQCQM